MTYDPKQIVFTDCETTGLDIFNHEVWEMAFILWDGENWEETVFKVWPSNLTAADPMALSINGFYTRPELRSGESDWDAVGNVVDWMAYNLAGKHLIGACPWFDDRFYQKFMLTYNHVPTWHYHLIDVEALAIGFLAGRLFEKDGETLELPLPWKSNWIAEQLGMYRVPGGRHTALGDAREVKQVFELITGTRDMERWDCGITMDGEGDGSQETT